MVPTYMLVQGGKVIIPVEVGKGLAVLSRRTERVGWGEKIG